MTSERQWMEGIDEDEGVEKGE